MTSQLINRWLGAGEWRILLRNRNSLYNVVMIVSLLRLMLGARQDQGNDELCDQRHHHQHHPSDTSVADHHHIDFWKKKSILKYDL